MGSDKMGSELQQWGLTGQELERLRAHLSGTEIKTVEQLPATWPDALLLVSAAHSIEFVRWAQDRTNALGDPPLPILIYLPPDTLEPDETSFYCNGYVSDEDWTRLNILVDCPEALEAETAAADVPIAFLQRLKVPIWNVPIARIPFHDSVRNRPDSRIRQLLTDSPQSYFAFVEALESNRLLAAMSPAPSHAIQLSLCLSGILESAGNLVAQMQSRTEDEIEQFRAAVVAPLVAALYSPLQSQLITATAGAGQVTLRGAHQTERVASHKEKGNDKSDPIDRVLETLALDSTVPVRLEMAGCKVDILLDGIDEEGAIIFRNLRCPNPVAKFCVEIWDGEQPLLIQQSETDPLNGERRVVIPFALWNDVIHEADQLFIFSEE